jgi:hypothetical protein
MINCKIVPGKNLAAITVDPLSRRIPENAPLLWTKRPAMIALLKERRKE